MVDMTVKSGVTLLKNGILIDGTGKEPVEDAGVVIQEGRIVDVGPVSKLELPKSSINEIDVTGKFILPGLVDAHVHLGAQGEIPLQQQDIMPIEFNTILAIKNAEMTLEAGVTTIRDMGCRGNISIAIRDAIKQNLIRGPKIVAAGRHITVTGGLVDYFPGWIASKAGPCFVVNGIDSTIQAVRELIKAGSDFIKLDGSGATVNPYSPPHKRTMSHEEMSAAVKEAHRNGRRVAVHAEPIEAIQDALKAGADTIEHGFFLDEETAQMMYEYGTVFVPTLCIIKLRYETGKEVLEDFVWERVQSVYLHHRKAFKIAQEVGLKIAAGSDAGNLVPNGANPKELEAMVSYGFSPLQAIHAATQVSAEALGVEQEVGTLEKGKAADILIMTKNPLKDITVLQKMENLSLVMKDGQIVRSRR